MVRIDIIDDHAHGLRAPVSAIAWHGHEPLAELALAGWADHDHAVSEREFGMHHRTAVVRPYRRHVVGTRTPVVAIRLQRLGRRSTGRKSRSLLWIWARSTSHSPLKDRTNHPRMPKGCVPFLFLQRSTCSVVALGAKGVRTNADCSATLLEQTAMPDEAGVALLRHAAETLGLSARGFHRTLKVARTIADLESSETVSRAHIAEALSYRGETLRQARAA
jgi:Magnesium chelatase, subunit ChlI C-terminal